MLKSQEKTIQELKFQLEEKRIQLKEQDLYTVERKENHFEEPKISDKNSSEIAKEIKSLYGSYQFLSQEFSHLLANNKESQKKLDGELSVIEGNYQSIKNNIKKTFDISDNLSDSAKKAFTVAEKVQKGIYNVTDSLSNAIASSDILFDQSQKIGKIIEIIREIAEKTHVLSINASIVSARAGIHGKAFDVVAREIRNLASESDGSIQEIEDKVSEIQNTINDMVIKIQKANTKIIDEKELLSAVVGSLQGITLGVEVLRAVSNVANEKSLDQSDVVYKIINKYKNLLADWEKLDIEKENLQMNQLEKLLTITTDPDSNVTG